MKSPSVLESFEKSKEMTKKARREIWQTLSFLLILALLLYYVSSRKPEFFYEPAQKTGSVTTSTQDASEGAKGNFFAEFKLSREKIQKEQMDLIKKVMEDEKASPSVREEAHLHYLALVDAMGKELKIEGILKAKGWDSLAFLSGDSCTVVVKTSKLNETDAAAIGDVVRRIAKVGLQNITIIPAP